MEPKKILETLKQQWEAEDNHPNSQDRVEFRCDGCDHHDWDAYVRPEKPTLLTKSKDESNS